MPDKFITLPQLTKSVKSLVNKINTEITAEDSKIGDLSNLTTSATGNLVAAINSITANSGTTDLSNYVQKTSNESGNTGGVNYIFDGINGISYKNTTSKLQENIEIDQYNIALRREKENNEETEYKKSLITLGDNSSDNSSIILKTSNDIYDENYGWGEAEYSSIELDNDAITIQSKEIQIGGSAYDSSSYINIASSFEVQTTDGVQVAKINNLQTPTQNNQAANKYYVDQKFNNITHPVTSVNGATGAVVLNIPAAQVNSDWNATSGVAQILNKPTIPDVPDWALAATKPTYTADEVGAATSYHTHTLIKSTYGENSSTISANANSSNATISIQAESPSGTVHTDTLTFTGDVGRGVKITGLTTPSADKDAANKKYVDDSISEISVPTKTSDLTNDSGYLTSYTETDPTVPAWAKAATKPTYTAAEVGALPNDTIIPTVPTNISAFTNDAGYLTSYTETDPTVPAWAKASTKPTYTASEVGAATSSHVHGNVTNDGTITVNTSMANGDRLLFSDTSDSSKIKSTSITIGTSTTQYLANNGTWQNLPTVSVSQKLTSGTEIGSVNNTKLYAPAPYDDSALAARVTALEQLEWATYYSGRSNPSNSQGQNGDIYLQY